MDKTTLTIKRFIDDIDSFKEIKIEISETNRGGDEDDILDWLGKI